MSDARLRELERRWRREASVEVFCEFAAACARSGMRAPPADAADVWGPQRLVLGARLGDPDARRTFGLPDEPDPDDVYSWVLRLEPARLPSEDGGWTLWGRELFARIGAATARVVLELQPEPTLRAAVEALSSWATTGATGESSAVLALRQRVAAQSQRTLVRGGPDAATRDLHRRVVLSVACACTCATMPEPGNGAAANAALHASMAVGAPVVVAAIRRELLPWVLFARG